MQPIFGVNICIYSSYTIVANTCGASSGKHGMDAVPIRNAHITRTHTLCAGKGNLILFCIMATSLDVYITMQSVGIHIDR